MTTSRPTPIKLLTIGTVLFILSGCTHATSKGTSPATAPTTTPTPVAPSPSITPQQREILDAYQTFRDSVVVAFSDPTQSNLEIEKHATHKALAGIKSTIVHYREGGYKMIGKPQSHPKITSINERANPPEAHITDCLDNTQWTLVNAETGESVTAPNQNIKYWTSVELYKLEGHWYVSEDTPDRTRKC